MLFFEKLRENLVGGMFAYVEQELQSAQTEGEKFVAEKLLKLLKIMERADGIVDEQEISDKEKQFCKDHYELMLTLISSVHVLAEFSNQMHLHPLKRVFAGAYVQGFPGTLELCLASGEYDDDELREIVKKALGYGMQEHTKGELVQYPTDMVSKLGAAIGGQGIHVQNLSSNLEKLLDEYPANDRNRILDHISENMKVHEAVIGGDGVASVYEFTDKKTNKLIPKNIRTTAHFEALKIAKKIPSIECAQELHQYFKSAGSQTESLSPEARDVVGEIKNTGLDLTEIMKTYCEIVFEKKLDNTHSQSPWLMSHGNFL